jgi:Zn-dependent protease with chaperone function
VRFWLSTVLLGLAWFATINIVSTLAVWLIASTPAMARLRTAGAFLTLRFLPVVLSTLFVVTVFLPAHWRFEPFEAEESFGALLSGLAIAAGAMLVRSGWRAVAVVWRERHVFSFALQHAQTIAADAIAVSALRGVSLAGILRPRILVGTDALRVLTPAELDVAISHEIAHRQSRDNLKRFLMFCSPDLVAWLPAGRALEARWQAEAECQADAHAVAGDEERAIVLASALVKVARLTHRGGMNLPSPAWSGFHVPTLLETRIRRLVAGPSSLPAHGRFTRALVAVSIVAVSALVFATDLSYRLHQVTEALVANLP